MISDSPPFWWRRRDWRALALWPLSEAYGRVAGRVMDRRRRVSLPIPVLCVGNFTAGGAGKTPTALTLGAAARQMGLTPGFLSRGYGGGLDVTTLVDPARHRALDVGDEPLLLATAGPTVISRKRVEGARRLIAEGVDLIIMDDGFQSARLAMDVALVVVDSHRGIGNGLMIPAGPVRAPLPLQLRHASALLAVGNGPAADRLVRQAARMGKPVHVATLVPRPLPELAGRPVLAFAGIADPDKFFRTVESLGAQIAVRRSFADHQHLQEDEIADLLKDAAKDGLTLVTTAKDHVRLAGHHGAAEDLAKQAVIIPVDMRFDDPSAPAALIDMAMKRGRERMIRDGLTG